MRRTRTVNLIKKAKTYYARFFPYDCDARVKKSLKVQDLEEATVIADELNKYLQLNLEPDTAIQIGIDPFIYELLYQKELLVPLSKTSKKLLNSVPNVDIENDLQLTAMAEHLFSMGKELTKSEMKVKELELEIIQLLEFKKKYILLY